MHSNDLFRYSPESDLSNDDSEDGSDEDLVNRGPGSAFTSSQRTEYAGIKEQMYQVLELSSYLCNSSQELPITVQ